MPRLTPVTDPSILAQLDGGGQRLKPVTDERILFELENSRPTPAKRIARFQLPDGKIARFEVPEGTTPEQAQAMIAREFPNMSGPPVGAAAGNQPAWKQGTPVSGNDERTRFLLEADRRGILPPDKKAMLDEAVKRGLVPKPAWMQGTPVNGPWKEYEQPASEGPWRDYAPKPKSKFRVEAPDGKIFDVEGPEGATAEQALAQVQASYQPRTEERGSDPTGSFGQNLAAAAGGAVVRAGRGIKQALDAPAKWLEEKFEPRTLYSLMARQKPSSLVGRVGEWFGMPTAAKSAAQTQGAIDEARIQDAPLLNTAGGKVGDLMGNIAMTVPAMLVPGANTYKGASAIGGALGLSQPTAGDESRLGNVATGAVAGAAGKMVGDKVAGAISGALANRTAKAAQAQAQNAPRDAALAAGREAGYVVPPRMVEKQGVLGSILEGFGGKVKLEQLASNRNAAVTNTLARKELGLAPDAPLDAGILQSIRKKAGEAYEAVASLPQPINWTPEYTQAIEAIKKQFSVMQSKFPTLANKDVNALVEAMDQGQFSAREAVEFVKAMRQSGNLNASVANTIKNANQTRNLGMAQLKAADAMDDLIAQNLRIAGNPQLFDDYLQARVLIAKTHTVENAMDNAGNVSAKKLLQQLDGKPYGGELKRAANFAGAFPKATQDAAKVEPYSILDTVAGAGLGGTFGLPAAAIPLARPVARSLVLSGPYQGMAAKPSYRTSGTLRVADLLAKQPALRAGIPGAAAGLSLADER